MAEFVLAVWIGGWAFLACCGFGRAAIDPGVDRLRWAFLGVAIGWLWPACGAYEAWRTLTKIWRRAS